MLVVFVPATTNSYAHYGEMCGYATNTQGDVQVHTSTELRDVWVSSSTRECGLQEPNFKFNFIYFLPIFPPPFGSWEFGVTQFQECRKLFETLQAVQLTKFQTSWKLLKFVDGYHLTWS